MEQNNYLGTEKVGVLLRRFAIPCIFSLIISCLYNIVDQIFVGNGVGYLGNAATGVIFPITVIGWGISLFFGDGAAADLSVSSGKNETQNIHTSVGNSILCSFLCGVAIIAVSYLCGDDLLRLIGARITARKMSWKCTVIPGTRGERIWSAPIWPGQPITEIYPGKNGATPINMSFASTAPSESKSVRMLSPRMY